MKIEQVEPKFKAITITLETVDEADIFINLIRLGGVSNSALSWDISMAHEISKWFSQQAKS